MHNTNGAIRSKYFQWPSTIMTIDKSENTSTYKSIIITNELQDIKSATGVEGIL